MSTHTSGQQHKLDANLERGSEETEMGVASPSTKRRLGTPPSDHDVVAAKLAKISRNSTTELHLAPSTATPEDSIAITTDFLTTSILARTLLTTNTSGPDLHPDPLESLKSSLEALPVPNDSLLTPFLKTTIPDAEPDEFTSLLCHEPPLTPVTVVNVLSPIDPSGTEWSSLSENHQVITEDENGKSYFNLGSADATIVARKASSLTPPGSNSLWLNGSCSNNSNEMDDNASSSSCESLSSSEDFFNSGEEFDASDDDEEEYSSYKQQRSTVLHLSLCKLNKFRSQQCVEPSLHRSVLICNTLRHIEQEIKSEDEVDESLKSRERLPSFWRPTSNHHPHCFSSSNSNQLTTDPRPLAPLPSDPYLSPNPYSTTNNPLTTSRDSGPPISNGQGPYLYDYNCLRPTPYHTTSYDYEQDLPSLEASTNNSTLVECDSGYGDEIYYYSTTAANTNPNPSSQQSPPQLLVETSPPLPLPNSNISNSSQPFLPFSNQPLQNPNPTERLIASTEKPEFESETDSDSSSNSPPPGGGWSNGVNNNKEVVPQTSFAQQESQCGMESRRSSQLNFASHTMPLDNLISSSYSSSL